MKIYAISNVNYCVRTNNAQDDSAQQTNKQTNKQTNSGMPTFEGGAKIFNWELIKRIKELLMFRYEEGLKEVNFIEGHYDLNSEQEKLVNTAKASLTEAIEKNAKSSK